MGALPKFSSSQRAAIVAQYVHDGRTLAWLAEAYGVSATTIHRYVREAGVACRRAAPPFRASSSPSMRGGRVVDDLRGLPEDKFTRCERRLGCFKRPSSKY